jgi:uncharacterized protein (DUF488 family)
MPMPRIVTIGVYGYEEDEFFAALQDAGVDLFCDIRLRRGVRGARYAFANSQRLQARLAEMGIGYLHRKDLAPPKEIRSLQNAADKSQKVAKRQRDTLSPEFIEAYRREILSDFSPSAFVDELPPHVKVVAFFCVERAPEACHRSLVAEQIAADLGLEVEHIG